MLAVVLSLPLVVLMVHFVPYSYRSKYRSSDYLGFTRFPTNCLATTPSTCPRSWKSGIPEGRATSRPLIYSQFIACHEGFASCGHVPIDPKTGAGIGNNGVTVGAGVDLGSKSSNFPAFSFLSSSLLRKLEPYFGLRRDLASCAVIERPLYLYLSEATALSNAVEEHMAEKVERRYNLDKDVEALTFSSLPRGIRTAIVSVWFQFGYPESYPRLWKYVTRNNWKEAVKELRNFYQNPSTQEKGNLRRRHDEADIIEATLLECNRSIDAVILLDESGSISSSDFAKSLDFVKNLIEAFPDQKLRGKDGTRFALSTFSSFYISHFHLSSYTSQSEYENAINNIDQVKGGTHLGQALNVTLLDQFTTKKGLRSEDHGFPRVLIVLTDGQSYDSVAAAAQSVRDRNIVIYAIGIGNYNRAQLKQVASSPSHVYTLSTFSGLETFIGTLTAATCNEPQPVSLNKTIQTLTRETEYLYFLYQVDVNFNLEIQVIDLAGETFVYVYRSNPHPYKYDNDLGFSTSSQKHKILVISPRAIDNSAKRSIRTQYGKAIYVSVTANTESASFTIEANACNPSNCTQGTNEVKSGATGKKSYTSSFGFMAVTLFVFRVFL